MPTTVLHHKWVRISNSTTDLCVPRYVKPLKRKEPIVHPALSCTVSTILRSSHESMTNWEIEYLSWWHSARPLPSRLYGSVNISSIRISTYLVYFGSINISFENAARTEASSLSYPVKKRLSGLQETPYSLRWEKPPLVRLCIKILSLAYLILLSCNCASYGLNCSFSETLSGESLSWPQQDLNLEDSITTCTLPQASQSGLGSTVEAEALSSSSAPQLIASWLDSSTVVTHARAPEPGTGFVSDSTDQPTLTTNPSVAEDVRKNLHADRYKLCPICQKIQLFRLSMNRQLAVFRCLYPDLVPFLDAELDPFLSQPRLPFQLRPEDNKELNEVKAHRKSEPPTVFPQSQYLPLITW